MIRRLSWQCPSDRSRPVAAVALDDLLDHLAENLRQPRDIAGLTLDDIYSDLLADVAGRVQCFLTDEVNQAQTVVDFDAQQFPNVVVFTAPAPKQALCIEPNSCPTDAFNLQQQGIESNVIVLKPGETTAPLASAAGRRPPALRPPRGGRPRSCGRRSWRASSPRGAEGPRASPRRADSALLRRDGLSDH